MLREAVAAGRTWHADRLVVFELRVHQQGQWCSQEGTPGFGQLIVQAVAGLRCFAPWL